MASMDGRQCRTHTQSRRLQNRRDETVWNCETFWPYAEYVGIRYAAAVSFGTNEALLSASVGIRRYPFCLNIVLLSKIPNRPNRSHLVACLVVSRIFILCSTTIWSSFALSRIVRRQRFDDDHGHGNSSRRWGKIYIARSIVLRQVKSSVTKGTVTKLMDSALLVMIPARLE